MYPYIRWLTVAVAFPLVLSVTVRGQEIPSDPEQRPRPVAMTRPLSNPQATLLTPPSGLFVCRGPGPTPDKEVNFPFIDGWLVRPGWDTVEPADAQYDWRYIDSEIATAKRLGKKITLMIWGGPHTPEWLYHAGAKEFHFVTSSRYRPKKNVGIPLLWDEVYLRKWTAVIQAAGRKYADEGTVALVHITGATANGLEMQLPQSPGDRKRWMEVGYSPEKVINAWKRIIDTYSKAFPHSALDIDVHPVLGSDKVAEEVAAYGFTKLSKRFGVFGGWLSGKSAENDAHHAAMHVIAQIYGTKSFADFQLIGNETRQPERFASGGVRSAIEQGMSWGARYFEVWQTDAMNPGLHSTLRELSLKIKHEK
jgi:Beta-galactosidase